MSNARHRRVLIVENAPDLRRAAQTLIRKDAKQHQNVEPAASDKTPDGTPVAFVGEMNGWNFRAGTTGVGTTGSGNAAEEVAAPEETSFDDRFAAAREVQSVQKPSVIQRMMDPVGAIPNIP